MPSLSTSFELSMRERGLSVITEEIRPKYPVLFKIFFSIHGDTELHSAKMRFGFLLKCRSQAFLSLDKNNKVAIEKISDILKFSGDYIGGLKMAYEITGKISFTDKVEIKCQ